MMSLLEVKEVMHWEIRLPQKIRTTGITATMEITRVNSHMVGLTIRQQTVGANELMQLSDVLRQLAVCIDNGVPLVSESPEA
jgi:NADH:ubiquinone oxidoreductase subunit D